MAYGYPQQMTPTITRIIKRPLTDIERGFAAKSYRSLQRALRGIAIVSLALFVINTFILSGVALDWSFSFVLTLLTIIVGALALGMSANAIMIRQKMSDVLRNGTAIEVQAPAYKGRAAKNMPSFTIGPITLIATPEVLRLIQEGAQTSVLCIPKLKAALSVNNVGLERGARVTCPPNLEAMAETAYPAMQQPMAPPQVAYPQYSQPAPQVQPQQPAYPQFEPPPPPDA
jgi:hypothetical protein